MRPQKATFLALLCFVLIINVKAQQNKLSKVKIYVQPSSEERLRVISSLYLDHFIEEDGAIMTEIGTEEMATLRSSGFRYEVLVDDVAANLEQINKPYFEGRANGTLNMDGSLRSGVQSRVAYEQPGGLLNNLITTPSAFVVQGTLGGYYSYAQMVTAITNLYTTYSPSGLVDTFHIGTSVEGRIIYAVKISDNAATDEANEPEVFFQGIQHAREAIGGSSMIFLMQYLCEQYSIDARIQNLVNNREIYIIVCMNPDGWEYNRGTNPSGGGGWRKNRKIIAGTNPGNYQYGVDLNRNWDIDWANCAGAIGGTSCGSGTISTANGTYWGTAPFSEPETNAVRNFIRSKHIVAANDQHSVGPYYSLPFGRPGLHTGADTLTIPQQQWYTYITALMGKYNGMRAGNSVQALGYEVAGGVKDWFLKGEIGAGIGGGEKYNILGMTGEGGYGTTGASTFWPPASSIITLCKGMTYQNLQMIYSAGSYVELQDMSDIGLTSLTGNLSFRIKRIGLDNQPVTVTAIPTINISSVGAPVTINSLPNYYDTYNGNISYTLPGTITAGQRVMFVWKVETLGVTYYDTITKFYNPTVLFTDNMETGAVGTNWTVSGGWAYVADSGYAASRALTESPGTSYSQTSTLTAQCRTNFNLTGATAAYLTFRTRHKAENFRDKLQVQVSPNGTTWTAIKGKTTVQEPTTNEGSTINGIPALTGIEPDWVNEVFDLSGYLNQSALRLRFVFTSNATATFFASQDEGFYIDDLQVIRSTTAFTTLGVDFISFTGKMLPTNEVALAWEANADNGHSHFEIEKSTDYTNFSTIGRVETNDPYTFLDRTPSIGNNYYRIKGVALNGEAKYTKVINIVYNPNQFVLNLYPNPVKDKINISLKTGEPEKLTIQVTDLSARQVLNKQILSDNSLTMVSIDAGSLSPQLYILKVINSKNETIATQKFIKQ